MSAIWTLKHDGVEQTFSEWGLDAPTRRLRSHGPDEFACIAHTDFDADALFDFEDTVEIYKQSDPDDAGTKVKWFEGPALQPRRVGSDSGEDVSYTIAGPWHWLERRVFMQTRKTWNGSALEDLNNPRVNLGFTVAGLKQNVKEQLKEILDWSIAKGDPIAYDDTYFPEVEIPIIPANQVSCAQAIQIVLQAIPDAVTWWDYSTATPTLHIARRGDLTAVTLGVEGKRVNIEPRPDLKTSAVVIHYEVSSQSDGQVYVGHTVDKWPVSATGEESGAALFSISLQGSQSTYQKTDLEVQPINAASSNQQEQDAWWQEKVSWLSDADLASFSIVGVARNSALPNEPTKGAPAPWMKDGQGNAINAVVDTITATIRFEYDDGRKGERLATVRVLATDAETGLYTTLSSHISGEPVPSGLAQAYFNATSVLQYQGNVVFVAEDVAGSVGIGNVLRLSGGRAEWATMDAMIWGVSEDIDRGQTMLEIGPIEPLTPAQFVANLELWRERFVWQNTLAQTAAQYGALGEVETTDEIAKENTAEGHEMLRRLIMQPEDAQDASLVDLNIADANGETIKLREVNICYTDDAGQKYTGKILCLCSEPFDLVEA